jgi:hypothetical protein
MFAATFKRPTNQGRRKMAAIIKTIKTEQGMQGTVIVYLQVSSPAGRHTFEMKFPDQGSAGANEKQAHQDLIAFCEETLESLRSVGG